MRILASAPCDAGYSSTSIPEPETDECHGKNSMHACMREERSIGLAAHSPMASPTRKRLRCAHALYALALPLAAAAAGTRHSPVPPALNTNADAVDDTDAATRHARNTLTHLIIRPCAIRPAKNLSARGRGQKLAS